MAETSCAVTTVRRYDLTHAQRDEATGERGEGSWGEMRCLSAIAFWRQFFFIKEIRTTESFIKTDAWHFNLAGRKAITCRIAPLATAAGHVTSSRLVPSQQTSRHTVISQAQDALSSRIECATPHSPYSTLSSLNSTQ